MLRLFWMCPQELSRQASTPHLGHIACRADREMIGIGWLCPRHRVVAADSDEYHLASGSGCVRPGLVPLPCPCIRTGMTTVGWLRMSSGVRSCCGAIRLTPAVPALEVRPHTLPHSRRLTTVACATAVERRVHSAWHMASIGAQTYNRGDLIGRRHREAEDSDFRSGRNAVGVVRRQARDTDSCAEI